MRDIIIDECELSIAANAVQRDVNKLLDVMSQYNAVLSKLQDDGIRDNAICAQFSAIAEEIAFCGEQLKTNISSIGTTVNRGIERIEDADAFRFPNTTLADLVDQLLSAF